MNEVTERCEQVPQECDSKTKVISVYKSEGKSLGWNRLSHRSSATLGQIFKLTLFPFLHL